jgi:hypothetical protein
MEPESVVPATVNHQTGGRHMTIMIGIDPHKATHRPYPHGRSRGLAEFDALELGQDVGLHRRQPREGLGVSSLGGGFRCRPLISVVRLRPCRR